MINHSNAMIVSVRQNQASSFVLGIKLIGDATGECDLSFNSLVFRIARVGTARHNNGTAL
jgi:hypothetical protein